MFMRFLGLGIGHCGQHTAVEPDPAVDTMDDFQTCVDDDKESDDQKSDDEEESAEDEEDEDFVDEEDIDCDDEDLGYGDL
jgi:hypothetical protein